MNERMRLWFKRLGIAGFMFFLIKGLIWLFFGASLFKWLVEG